MNLSLGSGVTPLNYEDTAVNFSTKGIVVVVVVVVVVVHYYAGVWRSWLQLTSA